MIDLVGRASSRAETSNFQSFLSTIICKSVISSEDNELPVRKNPEAAAHIHLGQSNIVLPTVTTEKRAPWLANETAHQLLASNLGGGDSMDRGRLLIDA
jgi:hypothetical protein